MGQIIDLEDDERFVSEELSGIQWYSDCSHAQPGEGRQQG